MASYRFPCRQLLFLCILLVGSFGGNCAVHGASDSADAQEDGMVRVVVGLSDLVATSTEKKQVVQSKAYYYGPHKHWLEDLAATYNATITTELRHTHAVALTIPQEKVPLLQQDAQFVQYLELDPLVHYFGETVTWSTQMVGALSASLPTAPANQIDNEYCFKLCIVDAGVLVNHPDLVRGCCINMGTYLLDWRRAKEYHSLSAIRVSSFCFTTTITFL